MIDVERQALDDQGYVVLERLLDQDTLETLRARTEQLYKLEGQHAGAEFLTEPGARRLANLVDKGKVYEEIIVHPRVLEVVGHVLGPRFKLSSLNARSANPYSNEAQPLHCDAGALPDQQRILGLQHHLVPRCFYSNKWANSCCARFATLGPLSPGCVGRSESTPPRRSPPDCSGGQCDRDEYACLAWRYGERVGFFAQRSARVLLPIR